MIILRQKEYGLKDIRKKIAEKLRNSIEKDKQAASKSHIKAIVSRRGVDYEDAVIMRRLRASGKSRRTKVRSNSTLGDNINISFKNKNGYYRNRIEYIPSRGSAGLAHELGHTIEREEGGLIGKAIDNLSDRARTEQIKTKTPKEKGLLTSAKRFIQGKLISENERRASNSGVKLLKKIGASDKLLKRSREELDGSLGTYKNESKVDYKRPIYNLIKTKDDPEI